MPADFVAQLRNAARSYRAAFDSRGAHLATRRGAYEGIRNAVEEGRKLILSLSVLVTRRLRGNAAALAEWMQLKRVTVQGSRSIKESAAVTYSATTESAAPVTATATPVTATATPVTATATTAKAA